MVMFGGTDGHAALDDVWGLHAATSAWERWHCTGAAAGFRAALAHPQSALASV